MIALLTAFFFFFFIYILQTLYAFYELYLTCFINCSRSPSSSLHHYASPAFNLHYASPGYVSIKARKVELWHVSCAAIFYFPKERKPNSKMMSHFVRAEERSGSVTCFVCGSLLEQGRDKKTRIVTTSAGKRKGNQESWLPFVHDTSAKKRNLELWHVSCVVLYLAKIFFF